MLPCLPFGRTGHHSTRLIFGAAALGGMSQARADMALAHVLAAGINHIDTAASYGNSEARLHDFLADHRSEFFLATKTGERDGAGARREIEQSLQRMGVQQIDLIQLHNLVEPEEWEVAHAPGGVVDALVQARDEGLVRFIGVTGHGTRIPAMHLRSLDRFPYDSVLFPYNFTMMSDPVYRATVEELIALCATRGAAVQTIKAVARRRWPEDSTEPHYSWYQPLPAGDALRRAVAYVLSRPGVFLNTSSDGRLLGAIVEAATEAADAPTAELMEADAAELGITPLFDGAALERI